MEIVFKDTEKIVEIWLSNEDKRDSALSERLPDMYREFKRKGYLAVVYESGSESLFDNTLSLLLHNRDALVKQEIEAEKLIAKQAPA